jgi:hypothetical protein
MNRELLNRALEAVRAFYNDTSVPPEVTHEGLEELQELISDLVNALDD